MRGERLSSVLGKPHVVKALFALAENPGISAARLARDMGASQPVTGQVMAEHLEKAGLARVEVVSSPFPGQQAWSISLTPLGHRLAEVLEAALTVLPDDEEVPVRDIAELDRARREMKEVTDALYEARKKREQKGGDGTG